MCAKAVSLDNIRILMGSAYPPGWAVGEVLGRMEDVTQIWKGGVR